MAGRASQRKGKLGELQWVARLKAAGFRAERRGYLQRFRRCDLFTEPDVYSPDLDGIHFEIKSCKRPLLNAWWQQATRDAGDRSPVVVWKKPGGEWLAIIRGEHLLELLKNETENQES